MFEKEVEKWVSNNFKLYLREPSIVVAKHAFKDGAEFGYNKANEKYSELSKAVFELKGEFMACPLDNTDRLGELIDRLNNL